MRLGIKNTVGYIKRYRRINLTWLLVWLAIGLGIFAVGMLIWHTRANILTVLAVLMVLPGAKRVVALVAAGRKRSVAAERCQAVEAAAGGFVYGQSVDTFRYEDEEDLEKLNEDTINTSEESSEENGIDRKHRSDFDLEDETAVIFTDYIFTSTEKIMMLDFLVEKDGNIFALPAPGSVDVEYMKKYLTDGIRRNSSAYHVLFVGSDEELLKKIKGRSPVKISREDRRDTIAWLKSLAA